MDWKKSNVIREADGIHFDLDPRVVADARSAKGEVNFVSHAHADHMFTGTGEVVCSELTARLCEERCDTSLEHSSSHERIELLESGHILGSRSAVIDTGEERILYTGDVSTNERAYLKGFEPVDAEVLVLETTYGIPAYALPDQKSVEDRIKEWIEENSGSLFLFAYALGKAQKVQSIIQEVDDRPVVAHGAVKKMNDAVEKHTDLEFDAVPYSDNKELLERGDAIFIGPTRCSRQDAVNSLVEESGGIKAGFSGWAVNEGFRYRNGYDKAFPYSDHCGFQDLVELVEQVDPRKVYTHHGFDEAFAAHLKRELGYDARALKRNQASLTDF